MQISTNIIINGSKNKPITLDVFYEKTGKPKSIVIFVHGFKGFKDWGHFNEIAKTFAEEDFIFVKFNFSYNGTTPNNPLVFDDLDAFGNNNYIIELDDLGLVIDWISKNESLAKEVNPNSIHLIGHSRGGGIVVLKAGEDKRITKTTTWAGVSDFLNRHNQKTIKLWKEKGVVHTYNMRTEQQMPLYYQFYETIQNNKERLNIVKAAKRLTIPFLIIHGTADNAVSLNDAKELNQACKKSELLVIENGDHTFGAKHPFTSSVFPEHAHHVIQHTLEFFKK